MPAHASLLLAALVVVGTVVAAASQGTQGPAPAAHKVVLEVTGDASQWAAALNNVENLQKALGAAQTQVAVVIHGSALGLVLAGNTEHKDRLERLAAGGVVFAACENTMRRERVTKADLLPFATTVDAAIAEIVRKQEAGWSYVKAGH